MADLFDGLLPAMRRQGAHAAALAKLQCVDTCVQYAAVQYAACLLGVLVGSCRGVAPHPSPARVMACGGGGLPYDSLLIADAPAYDLLNAAVCSNMLVACALEIAQ